MSKPLGGLEFYFLPQSVFLEFFAGMADIGSLVISAHFVAPRLEQIALRLQRPAVARVFVGQLPEAACKMIPYFYALCAEAQRAAAEAALVAAGTLEARVVDDRALWLECLHEHLWRLLIDWPQALGVADAHEDFVAWRNGRQEAGLFALSRSVVDKALSDGAIKKCREKLVDRNDLLPHSPPSMNAARFLSFWRGEADCLPDLPHPGCVADAFERRVAELQWALAGLLEGRRFPLDSAGGDGWGVGQCLTARGVLTHAVHVVDERVAKYQVWAPTDRYFADAGALTALLAGDEWPDIEAARRGLRLAILALDPCLPFEVEMSHA